MRGRRTFWPGIAKLLQWWQPDLADTERVSPWCAHAWLPLAIDSLGVECSAPAARWAQWSAGKPAHQRRRARVHSSQPVRKFLLARAHMGWGRVIHPWMSRGIVPDIEILHAPGGSHAAPLLVTSKPVREALLIDER